uniref:Uncharacterized protein n=1 Tax=Myoviridae sp. ctLnO19 TaxID=2825085 RepID=A0A8S5P1T0_9CAUD|nr:MAG TPA: hypothetical protein [Myoviridae sp. ctLnO19]
MFFFIKRVFPMYILDKGLGEPVTRGPRERI